MSNSAEMVLNKEEQIHDKLSHDILDGMADWVRVIDKNGIVIYENETMRKEIGFNSLGKSCHFSLGKSCPCKKCITETAFATGAISEKEQVIRDRVFSIKSSPVKDSNGEIYAVVEVFRDVTREKNLEKEVLKRNKKMNKDLKYSRAIQKKMLPAKGNYGSVSIDYIYKPSEVLSGDMFDIFNIDNRYTGIYISDVVGHGVSASILTMFVRQTMKAIMDTTTKPSKVLSELHQSFLDLNFDDDKYFTMIYGVLDNKYKTFTYANAGHNSLPLLINKKGVQILENSGYPICYLFDNIEYEEKTIEVKKNDKLLFYTDGIIELRNRFGEEFGIDRLKNSIEDKKGNLIDHIQDAMDEFHYDAPQDDIALLNVKIN
ncbi:SpoIIE family protein phosphatase [Clostridium sp. D2Q-14]|uniref:SpoIIE family protein phosphatase n=1 Tax=Anaeromonas gelatinilytica TaxID=2683194 RepID=UPI00193B65BE|nr:SpoIIE family protein phosphatase [Anaeromonas gelatinilytica]MBS4536326.1 SpoIIE family protein phosphatase [Anaeromonas gelatinilytica]